MINNEKYSDYFISYKSTIMQTLDKLNRIKNKSLIVVDDENRIIGTLTDGDIRRYILKTGKIEGKALDACCKNPIISDKNYNKIEILQKMKSQNIKIIPVIDENKKVVEILVNEDDKIKTKVLKQLKTPVLIMAGGRGKRLDPITQIIPKPLIPLEENKTIIEIIMEKFAEYGTKEFWISLNYKSSLIKNYLSSLKLPYRIRYIQENKPLGTAGSLSLIRNKIKSENLIINNCDIIVEIDYSNLIEFHEKNHNDITIVGCIKNYKIPYGKLEIEKGGIIKKINEKPELNIIINTGLYIIKTELINNLKPNNFLNMNDFIEDCIKQKRKVILYPIHENQFIDIGEWDKYKKAIESILK
ncbi:MAG: sugar phosphate nucleotidyltransferase [Candidatus Calescibacterium sp.]|nr:sugar phosphate nucleotidyltransferase [Candidatus Calescibacterium sp.]MDW8132997.1 sugar phosphate nucleotidyltransferase [Candidatus Calescibacterium sp.]